MEPSVQIARSAGRVAPGPDGHALDRQAGLRRHEPGSVVVVVRPDVADDDGRAVALDGPARLLRGLLERRSLVAELEAVRQRHVERLRPRRMLGPGHAASVPVPDHSPETRRYVTWSPTKPSVGWRKPSGTVPMVAKPSDS